MVFIKNSISVLAIMLLAIALASCSHSLKSQSPIEPGIQSQDLPSPGIIAESNRSILAVYDAVIDPEAKTFTVTPSARDCTSHFPLTQMYPSVLKIMGFGWSPNVWADIKISHPAPGSGINVFDPRVIAIVPANVQNYFYFPYLDVNGNNKIILEPDGYTKLFDDLGGNMGGNANPFKAYFKSFPNRIWMSTGTTSETQRWYLDIAGFAGTIKF